MENLCKLLSLAIILACIGCTDNIRDITGGTTLGTSEVNPVDINLDGFDFLSKMQGQWVGSNRIIATDHSWFAFDYRAISPSHIHGIHEGGTQGNLFTSFFVTDYKGKRTLMARNGGVLNRLYRTSYFVLDKVENRNTEGKYYRFVDAIGGKNLMYFELRFKRDSLYFNAYTSNLGLRGLPKRHMTFKAKKNIADLAQTAARATNFPQNTVAWDFTTRLNSPNLYIVPGNSSPTTGTFLAQQQGVRDVYSLAALSGDPVTITDHPRLGTLIVNFTRNAAIANTDLFLYLSKEPLTDANGIMVSSSTAFDSVLHFPTIDKQDTETSFIYTYLHPGTYYLTVISDKNANLSPGQGDIMSPSRMITIAPQENKTETVTNINVQN